MNGWQSDDIGIDGGTSQERLAVAVMTACQLAAGKGTFPPMDGNQPVALIVNREDGMLVHSMISDWAALHVTAEGPAIERRSAIDDGKQKVYWVDSTGDGSISIRPMGWAPEHGEVVIDASANGYDHAMVWTIGDQCITSPAGAVQRLHFSINAEGRQAVSTVRSTLVPEDKDSVRKALAALVGARVRPFVLRVLKTANPHTRPARFYSLRDLFEGFGGRPWGATNTATAIAGKNPGAAQRMRPTVPNSDRDFKSFVKWIVDNHIPGVWYSFEDDSGDRIRVRPVEPRREVLVEYEPGKGEPDSKEHALVHRLIDVRFKGKAGDTLDPMDHPA